MELHELASVIRNRAIDTSLGEAFAVYRDGRTEETDTLGVERVVVDSSGLVTELSHDAYAVVDGTQYRVNYVRYYFRPDYAPTYDPHLPGLATLSASSPHPVIVQLAPVQDTEGRDMPQYAVIVATLGATD